MANPTGDSLIDTSHNVGSRIPPFPDDIRTAPLLTISLAKLLASNKEEHGRLFAASRSLGFFYLDMRECAEGKTLLSRADSIFSLMNEFFKLPMEEKRRYDLSKKRSYFGYKGKGKEVMDDQGNVDHNEMYNVCQPSVEKLSLILIWSLTRSTGRYPKMTYWPSRILYRRPSLLCLTVPSSSHTCRAITLSLQRSLGHSVIL